MADSKITALTSISTSSDPANDPLVIVDVSDTSMAATGTTKKVTLNQLLATSPTATLASATITGDLTVDTNVLAVNATTNAVGIGTTVAPAYSSKLRVEGGVEIHTSQALNIQPGNTNPYEIVNRSAGGFAFYPTGAALGMTLDASGNLSLANGNLVMATSGKGIDFAATASGSGTMTSELLNDYEEGTWTIGFSFGGGSTGITYVQNTGKYTKVGRLVTVFGAIDLSSKGSSTGNAAITGLPFAVGGASSDYSAASLHLVNITFADFPMGFGNPTTTTIPLQEVTNAGVRTNLTDADFANNSSMIFSLTYSV